MRRPDSSPLPDDVARDLAAIDAALAGAPVGEDPNGLAALALALRDERPVPDAGVRARLDARAARRCAPAQPATRRRSRLPAVAAAGCVAAAGLAALLVAGGGGDGGPRVLSDAGTTSPGTQRAAPQAATSPAPGPADATSDRVTPTATPPAAAMAPAASSAEALQAAPAPAPSRSVERDAALRIATAPRDLDAASRGVVRTTDALGGYVVSSQVESRARGGSATFDLRVPAPRLQTALARLSKLGRVRARNESSLDVTGRVVAARDRIDALTAERRGVLRQLAAAATPAQTAAARVRLRAVDVRLARAQAAREALRRRTAYSSIALEITTERPRSAATGGAGGGPWTPADALHDALRVLTIALGVALVALAALLPAGVLVLAVWGAVRFTRDRRRRAALDLAP